MALWNKVQQLQGDAVRQMQSVYGIRFPIEVRHFFAAWIEKQPWHEIDLDDTSHEQFAIQMRDALMKLLEDKISDLGSEDSFLMKLKLQETLQQFREMYGNHPMNLVQVVKNCLATEEKLVQQAERSSSPEDTNIADIVKNIAAQLDVLNSSTQGQEEDLRQQQQKQESFIIQYQDNLKINSHLQQLANQPNGQMRSDQESRLQKQKRTIELQLSEMAQELLQWRLKLADRHQETIAQLAQLQSQILDEQLINWKRQQQLAGNGASFDGNLEMLQGWCESLAELIWMNRQQIKRVELLRAQLPIDIPAGTTDLLPSLNSNITSLLSSLVTSTFIIEKQPPQVLKKDSRFTATVRLLVGGKLNVHMNPPQVRATIISEDQAQGLLKNDKNVKNESSGDILNNTGTMEYHQANGQLGVTFRNMALKRIRRAEKKGNETVTEEKFSILFQSQFSVGGGELVFQVWTLSLPVVVTVHGNQECNALATILWDNAFADPGRLPFQVPDKVLWPRLAEALNTKFVSSSARGLTRDNIYYLASKLFGSADDYSSQHVSWSQFNREPLPGRNFTFWEWFYSILKLTKDWLQGPWKERLIIGFISKIKSQELLLLKPTGTFLLRYSDSEMGGITIAWVDDDRNKPGDKQVWNLAPFTDRDFKIRGMGDRMKDLHNLTLLYPDIPKGQAFSRFWSQNTDGDSVLPGTGYVRPDIHTVIPGYDDLCNKFSLMNRPAAPLQYDDPQTPSAIPPQSPATSTTSNVYESHPGPVGQGTSSSNMAGVDRMEQEQPEFPDLSMEYSADDIDQINVNELLQMNKWSS